MNRKSVTRLGWLKDVTRRSWARRRWWLWLIVTLAYAWWAGVPAALGLALASVLAFSVICLSLLSWAKAVAERKLGLRTSDLVLASASNSFGVLFILLALVIFINSFTGAAINLYTSARDWPDQFTHFLESFGGVAIEADYLTILMYIFLAIVVAAIVMAIGRLRAGDPVDEKGALHLQVSVVEDQSAGIREYLWLLIGIFIGLIPVALKAPWVPNVLAAVVFPALVAAGRHDYREYRNRGPIWHPQARVAIRYEVRIVALGGPFFSWSQQGCYFSRGSRTLISAIRQYRRMAQLHSSEWAFVFAPLTLS